VKIGNCGHLLGQTGPAVTVTVTVLLRTLHALHVFREVIRGLIDSLRLSLTAVVAVLLVLTYCSYLIVQFLQSYQANVEDSVHVASAGNK